MMSNKCLFIESVSINGEWYDATWSAEVVDAETGDLMLRAWLEELMARRHLFPEQVAAVQQLAAEYDVPLRLARLRLEPGARWELVQERAAQAKPWGPEGSDRQGDRSCQ